MAKGFVKIVKWKTEGVTDPLALFLYYVLYSRVADPHHFNADPYPAFHLQQIRILLLIKVIRICDHYHSTTDPPKLHFGPPGLHWEHRGPPHLYLEPLNILNFNFNADPSGFIFNSDADPDPASKDNADPDPQLCYIGSVHGPPRLYLELLNLQNFDFNADPDSFFNLLWIRIQLPKNPALLTNPEWRGWQRRTGGSRTRWRRSSRGRCGSRGSTGTAAPSAPPHRT